jgi:hypothetical protein
VQNDSDRDSAGPGFAEHLLAKIAGLEDFCVLLIPVIFMAITSILRSGVENFE